MALGRRSRGSALGGLAATVAAMLIAQPGDAQSAASAEAAASAGIVDPLSIVSDQPVTMAAVLIYTPAPRRAASTGSGFSGLRAVPPAKLSTTATANPAIASFMVAGKADQSISVMVPSRLALVNVAEGNTVIVDTAISLGGAGAFGSQLGPRGTMLVNVRGSLAANGAPRAGRYRGVLIATAQYN